MSGIPAAIQAYSQDEEQNRVLRALPPSSYVRLRPYLEPVSFSLKQVLWNPDDAIESVYFPRTSALSLIVRLSDGGLVEAATVGNEGIVGMAAALGKERASMLALTQVAGQAARMCSSVFRGLVDDDASLRLMTLRCSHALLEQAAQTAACNAKHSVHQRCARWILMTHDRAHTEEFALTHQMLAVMLGTRRASVTEAALELQRLGVITYGYGSMRVTSREGLEAAACECYQTVETRLRRIFGHETSLQAH
jgi:CRP-like cAMP-binding protein